MNTFAGVPRRIGDRGDRTKLCVQEFHVPFLVPRFVRGMHWPGLQDRSNYQIDLQTRVPWTEVKSVQMTERCLAGVHKISPGQMRFAAV